MQYIYFASGLFGLCILKKLRPLPNLVITQKDKIGGRGMKDVIPTPVKKYCQEADIPFIEINSKNELSEIVSKNTANLLLLCDFGMFIPSTILNANQYGFFNIHPSLLPKYRGASPIQSALLDGAKQTGVTLMQMDSEIDHGPIVLQSSIMIDPNDTQQTLMNELSTQAADLWDNFLHQAEKLLANKKEQEHTRATFTHKFNKNDGYIPLEEIQSFIQSLAQKYNLNHLITTEKIQPKNVSGWSIHNKIRGLSDWPSAWSLLSDKRVVKLLKSHWDSVENILTITEIKIEGKVYIA